MPAPPGPPFVGPIGRFPRPPANYSWALSAAYGAPFLIQSASIFTAATNVTINLGTDPRTFPVTAHSLLVAIVSSPTSGRTCSGSDNVNGAYNTDVTAVSSVSICSFPNSAAGNISVTGAISGASTSLCMTVQEWGNVATTTPFDKSASSSGTTKTQGTTGTTAVLSQPLEVAIGCMTVNANSGTSFFAEPPLITDPRSPVTVSPNSFQCVGYQVVNSTAALSGSFAWSTAQTFRSAIATYKQGFPPTGPAAIHVYPSGFRMLRCGGSYSD